MFGNIFKSIGNIVTQPFRSAGNILSGKGNIGDVLGVGSLFMPGGQLTGNLGSMSLRNLGTSSLLGSTGLSALSDPRRMTMQDGVSLLSLLGGQGGQGGTVNASSLQGLDNQGLARLLANMQMASALQNEPRRQEALRRGFDALSPAGRNASAFSMANVAQRRGRETGMQNARTLANRGYASSVSDAAILAGMNEGNRQGNEIMRQARSPQAEAQAALGQAGLLGDPNGLSMLLNLQNAANSQRAADAAYNASRPPSFLETLLNVGSTVAPYFLNQNRTPAPRVVSKPKGAKR